MGGAVISVFDRQSADPRLISFQQEMLRRYLPNGMEFLQFDESRVLREFASPPWSEKEALSDGAHQFAAILDRCIYSLPYDHFILLGIDAVPISSRFFDFMLSNPRWLVGAAKSSPQVERRHQHVPFISPHAMSISREMYMALETSFSPTGPDGKIIDCGAWINIAAQRAGIPVVGLYPTDCLMPQWQVGWHQYGYATTYGDKLCQMMASGGVGLLIFDFFRDYALLMEEKFRSESHSTCQKGGIEYLDSSNFFDQRECSIV